MLTIKEQTYINSAIGCLNTVSNIMRDLKAMKAGTPLNVPERRFLVSVWENGRRVFEFHYAESYVLRLIRKLRKDFPEGRINIDPVEFENE